MLDGSVKRLSQTLSIRNNLMAIALHIAYIKRASGIGASAGMSADVVATGWLMGSV
jgi:hypothetical protein